jgi:Glycine/D-amino acid oxidases (deaminating)
MSAEIEIATSLWLSEAKPRYQEADQNVTCDVVIIGGGVTGICAAYHMLQLGARVAVIEETQLGAGASGRNAGFLLTGPVEHYARAVALLGREKARKLWQFSHRSVTGLVDLIQGLPLDCDLELSGALHAAASETEEEELKNSAALLAEDNLEIALLSREEVQKHLNSPDFFGGILYPHNGGLHPVKFLQELAAYLVDHGVRIFENTPAQEVEITDFDAAVVHTPKARLEAYLVLLATNAYTPRLRNFLENKVLPVRGHIIATEPAQRRLWSEVVYTNFGYEYFRQLSDGRIVIGGMRETVPGGDSLHYEEDPLPEVIAELERFLKTRFPPPMPAVEYRWAGLMGFSRDGLPIIGAIPGESNLFFAGAYTGHGWGFAYGVAEVTAKIMLEETTSDLELFSMRRFLK